jgi:nitrate reductase gamma subunit
MHERLHHFAEQHERYNPYQLLPLAAGLVIVTLAYLIVTRRRLRHEVAIRQEREDALTQALHKINVLSGLLAMCASCKRVRDEDQWEPVEVYLQRHGELSVSHDICPQCADDLYPEYVTKLIAPAS